MIIAHEILECQDWFGEDVVKNGEFPFRSVCSWAGAISVERCAGGVRVVDALGKAASRGVEKRHSSG